MLSKSSYLNRTYNYLEQESNAKPSSSMAVGSAIEVEAMAALKGCQLAVGRGLAHVLSLLLYCIVFTFSLYVPMSNEKVQVSYRTNIQ